MTPQALLAAHNIHLASTAPGRYYTICPQCSAKRSNAHQKNKVLGVTITADDSVHWGCNHCGWIGSEKGTGNGRGGNNLTTYDYQDASGTVTFQKVRAYDKNGEKFFWLRKPDGNGGWIKDTAGVDTKVLYRLPEIVEAVANGQTIAVVEGEKDANNLWRIGIPATCNAQGASELGKRPKWIRGHSEQLRGADIVVLNDNDAPGYAHADATCTLSLGIAKRVRRLDLALHWPNMPAKADVSDWLAAGHSGEDLTALIELAPDYIGKSVEPPTDGGLEDRIALDFSALHVERLRYVAVWNKWLQWDGMHWVFEDTLHAFHLARELCRDAKDARHKTVAAVVGLSRTDRRQAATTAQWDADPWLLGTPDGTIDLRTGKLMPARQGDYITKIASVTPASESPAQSCQMFLEFFQRVTGGNEKLQDFLQRACGYCLTGLTIEDSLFFLHGLGANGKGVFLRTVSGILGDYHKTASMDMFTVTHSERHPTDLAMLRGARLVTAIETEEGKRWDEAKLKALTGGDPIAARFMRQDFFEYTPQFKLMIAGNHKPSFRNVDEAIRRRVKLVPFTVTIPEAERDQELSTKLKADGPGILRWMIDGCLMWQRDGLNPPAIVTNATDSYLTGQDDLQHFIDDACVTGANESDSSEHLWDGWTDWAEDHHEFVGTQRRFGDRLEDKGYRRDREGIARTRIYRGIRCIRENAKKMAAELRKRADDARAREAEAKARSAEDRRAGNAGDADDIPF
jgi:putative DNA primase/helicase